MLRKALLLLLLLGTNGLGVSCNRNPMRPQQVSAQELQTPAYDRFFNRNTQEPRFALTGHRGAGSILYTKAVKNGLQYDGGKGAAGAFEPIAEHPEMVFAVFYNADPKTDPPSMQCQILARRDLLTGEVIGDPVGPVVLCNLSDQQCDLVLKNGVPSVLITAMADTARSNGWKPQVDPANLLNSFIYVEADPYFANYPEPVENPR